MSINAYPLQWPTGWKRTQHVYRKDGRFSTKGYGRPSRSVSISDGVQRVLGELDRMGYTRNDVVISTNVELRLDGLPRSDRSEPGDPGAAVYWRTGKGENKVMAIDIYTRVADNLAAIAATLEAMRAIERHGGAAILERAFTGFVALPAPDAPKHWRDVLGVIAAGPNAEQLKAAYRAAASAAHPDRAGGSDARMAAVNVAYDHARKELGL